MRLITAHLKSVSPYSASRFHDAPKLEKESHDAYEVRTWRQKMHADAEGFACIPPMAFKFGLESGARYLGQKISGQGNKTWTGKFVAAVSVFDPLVLPVKVADVEGERIFVNADGVRGSGKRVFKWFPIVPQWSGPVGFYVFDDVITLDVFLYHLKQFGAFIGIGRFRPQVGGFKGRFVVEDVEEQDVTA